MSNWTATVVGAPRRAGSFAEATVFFANTADSARNFSESFRYTTDTDLAAQAMTRIAQADAAALSAIVDGKVLDLSALPQTPAPATFTIEPTRLRSLILSIGNIADAFNSGAISTVVDLLNTPSITVLTSPTFSRDDLIAALPLAAQNALILYLADNPNARSFNDAIATLNRRDIVFWVTAFAAKGILTAAQAQAATTFINRQNSTLVSPAVQTFGSGAVIQLADVQRLTQ